MKNRIDTELIAPVVATEANAILLLWRARNLFDELQPLTEGPLRRGMETAFWRDLNAAWTIIRHL